MCVQLHVSFLWKEGGHHSLFKLRHSEDHAFIEAFLVGNLNAGVLDIKGARFWRLNEGLRCPLSWRLGGWPKGLYKGPTSFSSLFFLCQLFTLNL